jgi:NTE family protein
MHADAAALHVQSLYRALKLRDFAGAGELVDDAVILLNVATGDVHRGRSGLLEYARGWSTAFPDLTLELVKVESAGNRVLVEYERRGTHTGPLVTPRGHVPPTGMEMQVRFCDVLQLDDGLVTHVRSYFDTLTLLRQLGLTSGSPLHAPDRRAGLDLYAHPTDSGAPQRHKGIVHRFLSDVINRQDPAAVADTCAKNFVWHGGALGDWRGLKAYQGVLVSFFTAFPDFQLEALETIAEGDRVVVRYTMTGTHLGEFQGIAPTRKRVAGGGTNTYRIEENRIVEEWWQGDLLVLMQQMDAAPSLARLSSYS